MRVERRRWYFLNENIVLVAKKDFGDNDGKATKIERK